MGVTHSWRKENREKNCREVQIFLKLTPLRFNVRVLFTQPLKFGEIEEILKMV